MTKNLMITLAVVLVVVGTVYLLFYQPDEIVTVDISFSEYLPADTVAVFSLRNINSMVDNFPDTAIGQFFDKNNMARIMAELEAGPDDIQAYKAGYDRLFAALHHPAFRMVFGDDVDLAILPVDKSLFNIDFTKALQQSFLLMATSNVADMLEILSTKILTKTVEEFAHGSLIMTRITLDDGSFVFAYTDQSRLLVALEPGMIAQALTQRESGVGLAENEHFIAAVKFWQQAPVKLVQSRAFIQGDFIRKMLLEADNKEVQRIGQYLQGIHFVASVGGRNQDRWQQESMTAYSYDALDPLIRASVGLSMTNKNETLHMLSADPLAYGWLADLGTSSILEGLKTDQRLFTDLNAQLKNELGVSLEQLLQSFGSQGGMGLNRIVQSGIFPLPELVFAVQVKDRELIYNVLNKIRAKMSAQGLVVEYKEVNGQTIYSWPILPGEAAQPAIVLTDDMLYLTNGISSMKEMITLKQEGTTLLEPMKEALGVDLTAKIKDANSGVFVFWPARLSAQLDGVASWAVSIIESSEGVHVGFLKDELLRVLGSSEVIVLTSSLTRERGYSSMIIVDRQVDQIPETQ